MCPDLFCTKLAMVAPREGAEGLGLGSWDQLPWDASVNKWSNCQGQSNQCSVTKGHLWLAGHVNPRVAVSGANKKL